MALSPYDQQVYDAGFKYIPQSQYLLNPFQIPQAEEAAEARVSAGLPAINQSQGNMGYPGGITNLLTNYQNTIDDRQNRLTELNRPLTTFPSFPGPKTSGGLNAQQMYNIASEDLNNPFNRSAMSTTFPTRTAKEVMDYADDAIQDYKMQYATGQLGPSVIREKPTLGRRIQDAIYSTPFFNKPQSAQQIMEEGYTPGVNLGILSNILGKTDKFGTLSRPDQAFIAANMGYTGPTVFGENTTGGSKDPFGLNTRSAFGNYAERVGTEVDKLSDALSPTGAIGGKKDFQGATFNPVTGEFESEELTPEQIAELNRRTKLVRTKLNFYRGKKKERDEFREQEAQRIQDEIKAAAAAKDKAAALAAIKAQGEASYTPSIHGGTDYGRDSQGNQSFDFGGGFGIGSDGGPVSNRTGRGRQGYMLGGLADLVDIYD